MFKMCIVLLVVVAFLIILKLSFKLTNNFCKSKKRLDGKTCLVTGGTSGMGLEIAKELARRGARVIIACPFQEEGDDAQKQIKEETGSKDVEFKLLDLASFKSTAKFAADILKAESKLHILFNNAGISYTKEITEDRLNMALQVNYYGNYLLTLLLLPLLKKTGTPTEKSRIINTSSFLHYGATFDPEKLNNINYWNDYKGYANSKFCPVLFTMELARKLQGHNVVVNVIDPGPVGTPTFFRHSGKYLGYVIMVFLRTFCKNPWEGAQTALHVGLSEELEDISGQYFKNCLIHQAKLQGYNHGAGKALWDLSAKTVNLEEFVQGNKIFQ